MEFVLTVGAIVFDIDQRTLTNEAARDAQVVEWTVLRDNDRQTER